MFWFYQMKNLIYNWFNDIRVAIISNEKNIDINIMNINRKTSKFILFFILLHIISGFHIRKIPNISENKEDIKYKKTDNKNDSSNNITLTEPLSDNSFQLSVF